MKWAYLIPQMGGDCLTLKSVFYSVFNVELLSYIVWPFVFAAVISGFIKGRMPFQYTLKYIFVKYIDLMSVLR